MYNRVEDLVPFNKKKLKVGTVYYYNKNVTKYLNCAPAKIR